MHRRLGPAKTKETNRVDVLRIVKLVEPCFMNRVEHQIRCLVGSLEGKPAAQPLVSFKPTVVGIVSFESNAVTFSPLV